MTLDDVRSKMGSLFIEHLNRIGKDNNGPPVDKVHHYTNGIGFKGIIEFGELWLTHSDYLNDASEVKYGRRLASAELNDLAFILDCLEIDETYPSSERLNIEASGKKQFLEVVAHQLATVARFDHYVASFCLQDNLLSQWRAYGRQGGGFSLGVKIKQSILDRFKDGLCFCFPVLYDLDKQKEVIKNYIEDVFAVFCECLPEMTLEDIKNGTDPAQNEIYTHLVNGLYILGQLFKDPGFKVEHEFRIIVSVPVGHLENVEFRESNGILVPYMKLNFKHPKGSIELASVTCGPGPDSDASLYSARMFLNKHGYDERVLVTKSEIPLKA